MLPKLPLGFSFVKCIWNRKNIAICVRCQSTADIKTTFSWMYNFFVHTSVWTLCGQRYVIESWLIVYICICKYIYHFLQLFFSLSRYLPISEWLSYWTVLIGDHRGLFSLVRSCGGYRIASAWRATTVQHFENFLGLLEATDVWLEPQRSRHEIWGPFLATHFGNWAKLVEFARSFLLRSALYFFHMVADMLKKGRPSSMLKLGIQRIIYQKFVIFYFIIFIYFFSMMQKTGNKFPKTFYTLKLWKEKCKKV